MPAHVQHTPTAVTEAELALACWADDGGTALEPASAAQWRRIGAALTDRLPELAGRDGILVTCEEQTRSGAPAAFFPTRAALEIDRALFAPRPARIRPNRVGDEVNYPTAWGAFVHEAAHAAHSRWATPPELRGTALDEAAQLLEESRAEHCHLSRRPEDRRWLRATVRTLILPEINAQTPADPWRTGFAAGLVLARQDAGVLDDDETAPLRRTVEKILGPDLLDTLRTIWTAAHNTADDDTQQMLGHARAWCQALGTDAAGCVPPLDSAAGGIGELAAAVGEVTGAVTAHEAAQATAQARAEAARTARQEAKANRAARERQAAQTAKSVFNPGQKPHTPAHRRTPGRRSTSPVLGTRPPTGAEKSAAGQLARALRRAAYREPTTTTTASAVPPGRLSMRGALARDAQRAAGATPTAQPWVRTQRRHGPVPPLRVGIAVDVSASMRAATGPVASAAWILARATALTDPDSNTATVAYNRALTAITHPGRAASQVCEFTAQGGGHSLAEALDALTHALDLGHPDHGRLAVIASDGYYSPIETAEAAARISDLSASGCAVLHLAFEPDPIPLPGATLLELTDPTQAAPAIGQAATTALAAAARP
ncbi:hypothetical protein [Streptomyces sp. NPDC002851]